MVMPAGPGPARIGSPARALPGRSGARCGRGAATQRPPAPTARRSGVACGGSLVRMTRPLSELTTAIPLPSSSATQTRAPPRAIGPGGRGRDRCAPRSSDRGAAARRGAGWSPRATCRRSRRRRCRARGDAAERFPVAGSSRVTVPSRSLVTQAPCPSGGDPQRRLPTAIGAETLGPPLPSRRKSDGGGDRDDDDREAAEDPERRPPPPCARTSPARRSAPCALAAVAGEDGGRPHLGALAGAGGGDQLAGAAVAVGGVFGGRAADRRLHPLRHLRLGVGFAAREGGDAGHHLVEDAAERVDVGGGPIESPRHCSGDM